MQLKLTIEQDISSLSWQSVLLPVIFFIISVSGIVFAAILPSSLLLIFLPAFLAFFAGMVSFNAPLEFFLSVGLPLSFLFWSIRRNMKNRIHPDFTNDVRRPLTTLFLFLLFFGSFSIFPWTFQQISQHSQEISGWITTFQQPLQEKLQEKITEELKNAMSNETNTMDTIFEQRLQESLKVCQGNTPCETEIRKNAETEKKRILQEMQNAVSSFDEGNISPEKTSNIISEILQGLSKTSQERFSETTLLFLGGSLLFTLFSPLAWPLSFVTMLLFSVLFSFFKMIGVLHVTYEKVQREIIV